MREPALCLDLTLVEGSCGGFATNQAFLSCDLGVTLRAAVGVKESLLSCEEILSAWALMAVSL